MIAHDLQLMNQLKEINPYDTLARIPEKYEVKRQEEQVTRVDQPTEPVPLRQTRSKSVEQSLQNKRINIRIVSKSLRVPARSSHLREEEANPIM
jgi:hypothetical protein